MKQLLIVATWALAAAAACADDFQTEYLHQWHRWRGPLGIGVAPHADPPVEWSETKNIKWKVPIPGEGSATPIVWNGRVIVLTAVLPASSGTEAADATPSQPQGPAGRQGGRGGFGALPAPDGPVAFTVLCLDLESGKTIWSTVATEQRPHEGRHQTNSFASASAVTNGTHIYASFGSRGIYCLDMEGNIVWQRDLGDMQTRLGFGEGSSPALYQDTLVLTWDHEGQSSIVALDATTGQTRWQVPRDEHTTWATPLIVSHAGRVQVITNGSNRVRSYDLATGELIWECGGQASNPIPSPIVGGEVVYCMTGYQGFAVYAIPLDATGDITDTDKVLWFRKDTGPYVSSPTLVGNQLYFTKSRSGILMSLDARSGETIIDETRLPGINTVYASPAAAAGRIYLSGREGTTVVFEQGPEWKVLATNALDEGIDASPVLVGNTLLLRGQHSLYCIENE